MPTGRVWSAIGAVALFMLGMGILSYIVTVVFALLDILVTIPPLAEELLVGLVLLGGIYVYLDWRWGWKLDNIGMALKPRAMLWLPAGLIAGAAVAVASRVVDSLISGGAMPTFHFNATLGSALLVGVLLRGFIIEMLFRGAAISRYQADLVDRRHVLIAALATPPAVLLLQSFIGIGVPVDIFSIWELLMSLALSLLFLRTDSTWLTIGVRLGVVVTMAFLPFREQGATILWAVITAILFALEWRDYGRITRSGPRGPQRMQYGRVHRGPWGPH